MLMIVDSIKSQLRARDFLGLVQLALWQDGNHVHIFLLDLNQSHAGICPPVYEQSKGIYQGFWISTVVQHL